MMRPAARWQERAQLGDMPSCKAQATRRPHRRFDRGAVRTAELVEPQELFHAFKASSTCHRARYSRSTSRRDQAPPRSWPRGTIGEG